MELLSQTNNFILYDTYNSSTTNLTISGITIDFDTQLWIKIVDDVTNRYIIENINIHESCYYNCYDLSPTPTSTVTPTITPTKTNTPTPTLTTGLSPTPTPTETTTNTPTPTNTVTPGLSPTATPTQTPTNTITPTPTTTSQCTCVDSITYTLNLGGTISYTDCNGNYQEIIIGSPGQPPPSIGGPYYLVLTNTTGCININTLGGTADYTIISYGPCCNPSTPTPTPTMTPTPTFICNDCRNWEYLGESIPVEGDVIYYYNCDNGSLQTVVLNYGDPTGYICNCNSVDNPYSDNGTTLTEVGICSTPTPTPTATPTSTPPPIVITCNPVQNLIVTGVEFLGEGQVSIQISTQNNVDVDTTFDIYIDTTNYGNFFKNITISSGSNYASITDSIGSSGTPIVESYCINDVVGSVLITCDNFNCEGFSCPCVET